MTKRQRKQHWQNKPFFLTKTYKDGLRQIIWNHKRLSRGAQHVALRILDRFASTPTIFANLEGLAAECDMHRETMRKYATEVQNEGLFRLSTPPYWCRKGAHAQATEIYFPTKRVEKYLRDNGLLKTMAKNSPCSKSGNVDKIRVSPLAKLQNTPSTMAKNSPTYQEVAAPPAADGLGFAAAGADRPSLPGPATDTHGHSLGAIYEDEWVTATTVPQPGSTDGYDLGTRWRWSVDNTTCTLIGFSTCPITNGCVLVQFDDGGSSGWIETMDLKAIESKRDVDHNFKPGNKVKHVALKDGIVLTVDGDKIEVEFRERGIKQIHAKFLELCDAS